MPRVRAPLALLCAPLLSVGLLALPATAAPATPAAPETTTAPAATTGATTAADAAPGDWPTYHKDPGRTGLASDAPDLSQLSPAWNADALDGQVYAEPLVVGDTVLVATEANSVYALDIATGAVRWHSTAGTPVPANRLPCGSVTPVAGITGTPVVDTAAGRVYAVADIWDGSHAHHTLVGYDTATGQETLRRDVDPAGSTPENQLQRAALTMTQGQVVVAYGGNNGDCAAYHGFVVASRSDGTGPLATYQVPTQNGGAIWGTSGPVVDSGGYVYATTGNDFTDKTYDHGESIIKLDPSMHEVDSFAPSSWAGDNDRDFDLGSAGAALLPGGMLFQAGKNGQGYLVDTQHLGGIGGQVFTAPVCLSFGGDAYADGRLYVGCVNGGMRGLTYDGGRRRFDVSWAGPSDANGTPVVGGGLVWVVGWSSSVLYGLDPVTGATRVTRQLPAVEHFTTPTISGSNLLVPTTQGVVAFAGPAAPPAPSPAPVPAPGCATACRFFPVTPARLLDTRNGTGAPAARLGTAGLLPLQVTGRGGVPTGARAAVLNITAVSPSNRSNLRVYPHAAGVPNTSNLNYVAGQTVADLVTTALSADGLVDIRSSTGTVDVVADVTGYYVDPAADVPGAGFVPVAPARLLDSRQGSRLAERTTYPLQVAGTGGVPSGATAAVLNVTAVGPDKTTNVRVSPHGTGVPGASSLNATTGQVVANAVVVGLSGDGLVDLYNASGTTDLLVDVTGYFTGTGGAGFVPVGPTRVLDTRNGLGAPKAPVPAATPGSVQVAGSGLPVPADASAVVATMTVTNPSKRSNLRVFPGGAAVPGTSAVNMLAGQTVPNLVTVGLSGGALGYWNASGTTDLLADVAGYYTAQPTG